MKFLFALALFITTIALPAFFAYAQSTYVPIVSLPRLDPNAQTTQQYVEALFSLSIAAAAILAFIKIIFGGVKWMLSDVITDKSAAKKDIWGAVFGLLIVLSAVLVLQTINPNLVKLNFLQNAPSLNMQQTSNTETGGEEEPTERVHSTASVTPGTPNDTARIEAFKASCPNSGRVTERPLGTSILLTCYVPI